MDETASDEAETPPGDGGPPHNIAHGYTTLVYGLELLELYYGTKVDLNVRLALLLTQV